MQWRNLGETPVTETKWFTLNLADVELPDGRHLDHWVMRNPPAALATIVDEQDRVLLLWRHRFITDTWGWELAAGAVDPGESVEDAAQRELLEETGWKAGDLQHLITLQPSSGISSAEHHVYWADSGTYVGPPVDAFESDRVEWVPLKDVPDILARGELCGSSHVAALLLLLRIRGCRPASLLRSAERAAGSTSWSPRPAALH